MIIIYTSLTINSCGMIRFLPVILDLFMKINFQLLILLHNIIHHTMKHMNLNTVCFRFYYLTLPIWRFLILFKPYSNLFIQPWQNPMLLRHNLICYLNINCIIIFYFIAKSVIWHMGLCSVMHLLIVMLRKTLLRKLK